MIVRTDGKASNLSEVLMFNDSAAMIWNSLKDKVFTTSEIAWMLTEDYEVTYDRALADADALARCWKEYGLIEE